MQYIILDMEWNQAQTRDKVIREPIHLVGEIVQIGAVKLDEKFKFVDSFTVMISPCYYKKMNYRIAQLTGITNSDLRGGVTFEKALESFKAWCGEDFSIITWGGDDIPMLRDNIKLHNLDDAWIPCCYNVQPIFDNLITKENRQCSLTYAMERLGEIPYREHNALNDAINTAIVCSHLDLETALKEYERFKKTPKPKPEQNSQSHFLNRHFSSRGMALGDRECRLFPCPNCGRTLACGNWVHQSSDKYIALSECECGSGHFMRLIFRKNDDDTLRVGRLIYPLDDEHREYYARTVNKNRHSKKRKFRNGRKHKQTTV